MYCSQS